MNNNSDIKKDRIINAVLLVSIFVVIAGSLTLILTGKIDISTGLILMVLGICVLGGCLFIKNMKNDIYWRTVKSAFPRQSAESEPSQLNKE